MIPQLSPNEGQAEATNPDGGNTTIIETNV